MSGLVVKGASRPHHIRSKSSSRTHRGNDSQSEKDSRSKRASSKKATEDAKHDMSTAAFVRRVLCAGHLKPGTETSSSQPLEELLPPLTSSNAVDLQLYGIIAVIIKEFVQTWYSRITPDHEFVDEVVQIIAHCTRGFEQRLRRVDLETLLLNELPDVLNQHMEACRLAHSSAVNTTAASLGVDMRTLYHSAHPHPALSPVPTDSDTEQAAAQRSNEAVWRQLLIEGVLDLLLPPEDLQNPCLKVLVNEIFSELIIGNVLGGKVSEGWFLWEGITKAIQAVRNDGPALPEKLNPKKGARLEKFGLLAGQSSTKAPDRARQRARSVYAMIINAGCEILRMALLLYGLIRAAFIALRDAVYLPSRITPLAGPSSTSSPSASFTASPSPDGSVLRDVVQNPAAKGDRLAILESPVWRIPTSILGLDRRMPWLTGALSLVQYCAVHGPGQVGGVDARLDRLLAHHITTALLTPSRLPILLRTIRTNLFPNNAMAQGKPPPASAAEVRAIKRRCAEEILSLVPAPVRAVYFGPPAEGVERKEWEARRLEAEVLDLLGDAYLNKHLLFAVVEVVVCRVFPEMVEERG